MTAESAGSVSYDESVLCPGTGEVCPAKLALQETLAADITSYRERTEEPVSTWEDEDDDWFGDSEVSYGNFTSRTPGPTELTVIAKIRLAEYNKRAGKLGCSGALDTETGLDCPTRLDMIDNVGRSKFLRFIRKVTKRV